MNDKELELLLYLWLRRSNDLEIDSEDTLPLRPRRFRDNDANNGSLQNISRATGLTLKELDQLLSKDSALCKLQLIDSDLDLLCDVHHYLSGYSDDAGMKSFTIADECTVPFKQLAENNPDANLALDIIKNHDRKHPLNMLLYGPPGTGKTEFVRYLARRLGRNLIIKRASDLLGKYVGENEAKINQAFAEAEHTKSILFFDEADSFLQDRSNAEHEWQITKVNELLTKMENFKGIFIAVTNFDKYLNAASRRRFALKLGFEYLKPEGARHIWNAFFPGTECPESVCSLPLLTPGDFNAVNGRLQYLPASLKTPERIFLELKEEINAKDSRACLTMGF